MTRARKISLLLTLYVAQGLPYGFFTQALPVLLRKAQIGLPAIGFSSLLTLPWALKFLWAPAVDRFQIPGIGLRRSWLLCLQLTTIALYVTLSAVDFETNLSVVLIAFLLSNVLAASQDIATDGLAVDISDFSERGWINGVQVAGYRLGMIIGGMALLAVFDVLHWSGVMLAMAVVSLLCTWPVLLFRESTTRRVLPATRGFKDASREILHFFSLRGALPWAVVLLFYKFGHASATAMLRPWLVDQNGYSLTEIAWILGTGGFIAGFVGAMTGGFLCERFDRKRLLIVIGVAQFFAVASYLWPVLSEHASYKVMISASLDHFTSGIATVCLFTMMMDACTRERAASDYTAQACTVVVSQTLATSLSGLVAGHFGYGAHFALSAGIGLCALVLSAWIVSRASVRALLMRKTLVTGALLLVFTSPLFAARVAHAASADLGTGLDRFKAFDLHGTTFIPSGIRGVGEVLQGWGVSATFPLKSGAFEIDTFNGRGDGSTYYSLMLDYRRNIENDILPVHFTIGIQSDYYSPLGYTNKSGGGLNYGAGCMLPMGGPVYVRTDFRTRLGPGQSLLITVGVTYVFAGGSGG